MATTNAQLINWASDSKRTIAQLKNCYNAFVPPLPVLAAGATKAQLQHDIVTHLVTLPPAAVAAYQPPAATVNPRPTRTNNLTIVNGVLPNAVEGQSYNVQLVARGGNGNPLTWTVSPVAGLTLPRNFAYDANTGVISFTPQYGIAGTYSLDISVSDGTNSDRKNVALVVAQAAPAAPRRNVATTGSGFNWRPWAILGGIVLAGLLALWLLFAVIIPAIAANPINLGGNGGNGAGLGNGAAPAAAAIGMKYQYDLGCDKTATPYAYPACILQNLQSNSGTYGGNIKAAVEAIQKLASDNKAPSFESVNLTIPNTQAAVIWCPSGVKDNGGQFAPDISFPLINTSGSAWTYNLFVMNKGTGGPNRIVSSNTSDPCWMAYVH